MAPPIQVTLSTSQTKYKGEFVEGLFVQTRIFR